MELQILEGKFGYCKGNDHIQTILKPMDDDARVVWCSCGKVMTRNSNYGAPVIVVHDFALVSGKCRIHSTCQNSERCLYGS